MRGRKPGLEAIMRSVAGVYAGVAPECPEWLDEVARGEWNRIVPELEKMGILTPVDRILLASYCRAYSQWRACEMQVETDGLMIAGANGNLVLHPAARHASKMLGELRKSAAEFGFSPASRARVNAPPKPNDEMEDLDAFQRSSRVGAN